MTQLSKDDVRHIAKLARLRLTDEEVAKLATQLTSILQYVDMLKEVNTDGVPPTAQVTGIVNAFREDTVRKDGVAPDDLLATSPLPIIDHQISANSAHGN